MIPTQQHIPTQQQQRQVHVIPAPPFQQIHPAFQGNTYKRYYSQQRPHPIPPTHTQPQSQQQEFNASAISPMFFGYTSAPPFSKL